MNRMLWNSEVKSISREELEEAYTQLREAFESADVMSAEELRQKVDNYNEREFERKEQLQFAAYVKKYLGLFLKFFENLDTDKLLDSFYSLDNKLFPIYGANGFVNEEDFKSVLEAALEYTEKESKDVR